MIENLNKSHESVHFRENTHIRMYNNIQAEAYPSHWHNETEIILVRSGKLRVRCGGIDYSMETGDILMICPSSIHEISRESNGVRYYLLADLNNFPLLGELQTAFSILAPAVLISPETFPEHYARYLQAFRRIHELYFGDSFFETDFEALDPEYAYSLDDSAAVSSLPFMNETRIYSILLDFLASIATEFQVKSQKSTTRSVSPSGIVRNNQAIQDACGIVLAEYAEPLSLDSVSERVGFSKFHFERVFKQMMHMTFYQYVTKVRISHAQTLLSDSNLSITNIAVSSGFASSSAFSRAFRQETGRAPSDFRKIRQTHL